MKSSNQPPSHPAHLTLVWRVHYLADKFIFKNLNPNSKFDFTSVVGLKKRKNGVNVLEKTR